MAVTDKITTIRSIEDNSGSCALCETHNLNFECRAIQIQTQITKGYRLQIYAMTKIDPFRNPHII